MTETHLLEQQKWLRERREVIEIQKNNIAEEEILKLDDAAKDLLRAIKEEKAETRAAQPEVKVEGKTEEQNVGIIHETAKQPEVHEIVSENLKVHQSQNQPIDFVEEKAPAVEPPYLPEIPQEVEEKTWYQNRISFLKNTLP